MNSGYAVLATQIWALPYLVIYIVGIVIALRRRDMGSASNYAAIGFAAFAVATLVSSAQMVTFTTMRMSGDFSAVRTASYALAFTLAGNALRLVGIGFLMAAIFAKRPAPQTG